MHINKYKNYVVKPYENVNSYFSYIYNILYKI